VLRTVQRKLEMCGLLLIAAAPVGCALHHQHGDTARLAGDGVSVTGTGEAKAAPDIARSSMGIEVRADTAEQAVTQANERMAAVLAAIKAAGVADSDLQTHDFSVSFERDYNPGPQPLPVPAASVEKGARTSAAAAPDSATPRGFYRASNMVDVVVRDLTKASAVLSAATAAGANNVWGIQFDLENREVLFERARERAIVQAQQHAAQLAKLTGVKLGRVVSIDDQPAGDGQGPRMMGALSARAGNDASSVPVESGQLTVNHVVRVVYEIASP
jgi:uncharacterized protein YggE